LVRPLYFIRIALSNMVQSPFVSAVSVGTLSLSLLILSVFILVYANVQHVLESSARGLSVSVYLEDGLSPAYTADLKKQVSALSQVANLDYISKAQAKLDLKKRLGDHGELLEELDDNPLPASLELKLKDKFGTPEEIRSLIKRLEDLEGIDSVGYAWEWADKLSGLLNFFKLVGLFLGGLLFLTTVFIISNTIKLTLYSRQEELYIMRLIGATEGFIRAPFFIEGFLQGLMGGLFALGALLVMFNLFISRIELPFGLSVISLTFISTPAAWGIVGTGMLLGILGSLVSLGRFLR